MIVGLTLDASFDALCGLYWRTCVALSLGLVQILDRLAVHGLPIDTLHVTGGHTKNPLLLRLYPAATGCRLVQAACGEAVLLGTAMAAATAAGLHPCLGAAGRAMVQDGMVHEKSRQDLLHLRRDREMFERMIRARATLAPSD